MRRRLLIYTLAAAIGGAVLWACQRDRFGHDDPNAVEPTLTVNEARDFFEYQYSETMPYLTKLPQDRPVGMMPGDFTPLWDKARIGANREMDGADVPIDPKFIFVAVFNRVTPQGDTVRRTVDVIQKLVVKKWRDTEEYEAFCYIASIVPTPEYYAKHKNVGKEFRYAGDKGDFSGFVIYRTLAGRLVAIDNFQNGRPTRHNYFPHITAQNVDSIAQVARLSMGTTEFQGGTPAMYMAHTEEDDPWISDDVTVTAPKPRPDFPDRPTGLPTDPPKDPIDWPIPGGDYNGGGGGGGITGTTVRPIQEKDCGGQAGENAANAQAIYGAFNDAGLQDFINSKIDLSNEWSASLNYDSRNGTYSIGNEREGNGGHVTPGYTGGDTYTTALVHTHPSSGMPQSIADVASLINIRQSTGQTTTSFVAIRQENAPPIIYAIQIENSAQADAFYANYGDALKNQITNESQSIFTDINKAGGAMDESYAYAMSYLLDKYNTGVKILKCENGNFKQKETTISGNTIIRSTCK